MEWVNTSGPVLNYNVQSDPRQHYEVFGYIGVARIFDWGGGGQTTNHMQ